MPTPSIAASETTLVPDKEQSSSASAQDSFENAKSGKETIQDNEPLTKKQKAKRYTYSILDAIVKAGTGGGMGT